MKNNNSSQEEWTLCEEAKEPPEEENNNSTLENVLKRAFAKKFFHVNSLNEPEEEQ
jgi:hypothetical protein